MLTFYGGVNMTKRFKWLFAGFIVVYAFYLIIKFTKGV
nr:MAG TPA: hypothetical protein [Caudoviricetes sp.]